MYSVHTESTEQAYQKWTTFFRWLSKNTFNYSNEQKYL